MPPLKSSCQRQKGRLCRVQRLISLIEKLQNKGYQGGEEEITRKLLPKEYTELLATVDECDNDFQTFFKCYLRYEYRGSRYGKSQFTIFMSSPFHIRMQGSIDSEVVIWKTDITRDRNCTAEVKNIADRIETRREQNIHTDEKLLRPDCSFTLTDVGGYPPLVFEIAWSRTTDKLRRRAMELIQESAGEIRTVIGLDFSKTYSIWSRIRDYVGTEELPNRGPATAIVWRSIFDESGRQVFGPDGQPSIREDSYKFCDNDGKVQRNTKFQLSLRDFIPLRVILEGEWDEIQALDDTKLEFDSTTFIKYFDKALKAQKLEDEWMKSRQERQAESRAAAESERRRLPIRNIANINLGDVSLGRYNLRSRRN